MRKKCIGVSLVLFVLLLPTMAVATQIDKNENLSDSRISAKGVLQELDFSTWMYGTHILVGPGNRVLFALKSDFIDLDAYEGEMVVIEGTIIDEGGLDGGPPYLKVEKVSIMSEKEPGPAQGPESESEPESRPESNFYLSPDNPISVEVLLNKPGFSYNLEILGNAKNVMGPPTEPPTPDIFFYRSHDFENLGVIVYESSGPGVPGGGRYLSVRLSPKARKVAQIVGYETTFEIPRAYEPHQDGENLSSLGDLQIPGWSITTYEGRGFEAKYGEEQVIILSKCPTDVSISTLSIRVKEKVNAEIETAILDLLSKVFYFDELDIQKVKSELADMKEIEEVKFEPIFNFTDDRAREVLKTELIWLSGKEIIEGLSEEDIMKISEKARVGYAGVNARLIYKDGEWISYRESSYPLIKGIETLPLDLAETSFPVETVEITGEESEKTNWMLMSGVLGAIAFVAAAIVIVGTQS